MLKSRKKKLIIFFTTLGIIIGTTFVRSNDITIDVPISFCLFLLASLIVIKKKYLTGRQSVIYFSVSLIIIESLAIIIDWSLPTIGLPNMVVQYLGVFAGAILLSKSTPILIKVLIPILVCTFSIWYIGGGYNNYFQLLDGQTFTGRTDAPLNSQWYTVSREGDTLNSDFYTKQDKIILLDFWSTSCGVCFMQFPDLEKLYRKYKGNKNFIVQAVNIPLKQDTIGMAMYMIDKRKKYTFPVVIGTEQMRQAFGIEYYPSVFVLKNNRIIFDGRFELVEKFLDKELSR